MLPLQYKDTAFQTEAWALLSVGLFIVILRTISRVIHVGIRNFWADDYLMLFAAVCFRAQYISDWPMLTLYPDAIRHRGGDGSHH